MNKLSHKIAVLGGGQLGKMLATAAHQLGVKIIALDPTPDCPCHGVVDLHIVGDFKDPQQVANIMAEKPDVVTVEVEHVHVDILKEFERMGVTVAPASRTVEIIQDKLRQKQHLTANNIEVAPFMDAPTEDSVSAAIDVFGLPVVLKTRKLAYDGRGNYVIESRDQIHTAFQALGGSELYVEKFIKFRKELAVMVARNLDGSSMLTYPVVETVHKENICHTVIAPANVDTLTWQRASDVAKAAVNSLYGAGVFGVELFLTESNHILVNEIAPRPHNSGHYTIEACVTSQFEQHVRAILGLPLGDPSLKVNAAGMLNVLGQSTMELTMAPIERALTLPGASAHWYGKSEIRPRRKLGHITVVGSSTQEVASKLQELQGIPSKPGALVGIIMGSDSDLPKMKPATDILTEFNIPFEVRIVSAHRTPEYMVEYAKTAHLRGLKCIIAAAGGAAHLPGMTASLTPLPVIGVPINATTLGGKDALYSVVQMPRGVPVATVAIDNAVNAALLAARIIGIYRMDVLTKMVEYQRNMEAMIRAKDEQVSRQY